MKITIYSTPTCPYCIHAKEFFNKQKIPYTDFNVSTNQEKAEEMMEISGQMGVPVIKIDDQIIIGFDREKIEQILKN